MLSQRVYERLLDDVDARLLHLETAKDEPESPRKKISGLTVAS